MRPGSCNYHVDEITGLDGMIFRQANMGEMIAWRSTSATGGIRFFDQNFHTLADILAVALEADFILAALENL